MTPHGFRNGTGGLDRAEQGPASLRSSGRTPATATAPGPDPSAHRPHVSPHSSLEAQGLWADAGGHHAGAEDSAGEVRAQSDTPCFALLESQPAVPRTYAWLCTRGSSGEARGSTRGASALVLPLWGHVAILYPNSHVCKTGRAGFASGSFGECNSQRNALRNQAWRQRVTSLGCNNPWRNEFTAFGERPRPHPVLCAHL